MGQGEMQGEMHCARGPLLLQGLAHVPACFLLLCLAQPQQPTPPLSGILLGCVWRSSLGEMQHTLLFRSAAHDASQSGCSAPLVCTQNVHLNRLLIITELHFCTTSKAALQHMDGQHTCKVTQGQRQQSSDHITAPQQGKESETTALGAIKPQSKHEAKLSSNVQPTHVAFK